MTDTNYLVSTPVTPFSTPRSFKSVAHGKIYIGSPDTDPVNPANQIPVYVVNEDSSEVRISQPITINAGGFPVYNGQIMKFITKQNFSMAVYDAYGVQQFYWPDISKIDPSSVFNLLLNMLGADDGAKYIGGLGFLTPEMFGAKRDGVSDDSEAVQLAIYRASIGPTKIIWVGGGKYLCSPVNFNIPSGVSIIGGGAGSGFIFPTPPSSAMHEFFTLAGNGSLLKDFSIQFNTGGLGSIGAVQAYGVWFKDTATNCRAEGLTIDGKYSDTVMGFSNGFRLTGQDNTVRNCIVTHCSMGVTVRGTRLSILDSHFDNGYTTEDGTVWTSSKPQWDGIACEGILDCLISGNTCTNNGQSGIYIGGGGAGYSSGNIITNNRCFHNWNRGIDTGISGTQSTTNDVTNFTISDNHLRDNRETQLWLYGTNNSRISNNSVFETSEYNTLFGTQASATRAGIALGLSSACVNNVIEGNTVIVQSTTPYSVVYNGTGHKISASNRILGGQTTYIFGTDALRLYFNNVEFYQGTFSPQLIVGSGLTLSSSTGRYTIKSGRVNFDISLTITASSPTVSVNHRIYSRGIICISTRQILQR
ncbi:TPA: hypothetical protein I8Y21_003568 [Klebsiella oxytoca]|uniref:Pectate lyase superfamily protein n=1 Tax=Klebsiella oxytoca TaxID=571 RepID=A0AAN5REM7_KLEOX|nr:hypothetical protein [Klebsiella oxytoca]